jgi:hypothetical protein
LAENELFSDGDLGIKVIPPLLDPNLTANAARAKNVEWCETVWRPTCLFTGLTLDGNNIPVLPMGREHIKTFYRNLARDIPISMEFVPSKDMMHKMILRATQVDPFKIKTTLNPYDSTKVDLSNNWIMSESKK